MIYFPRCCPFCGAHANPVERPNPLSRWRWSVDCTKCGCSGPVEAAEMSAVIAWNSDFHTWKPICDAPQDRYIWVWCPPYSGLSELISLCHYHPDAGFCVDELRYPELWKDVIRPSSPIRV